MSPASPPRAMLRVLSDDRLARLAAGGSEPAFAVLYTRHQGALVAFCQSIVRDHDDAGDALQNTMLNAWRAIGRRGDAPVRAWLFHIARNESITVLRRRRPTCELRDEVPARHDVHDVAEHRAELAHLLDGVDGLSDRQRQALVLRSLGDLDYAEIADIQDTSADAVRQSVSVARRALRRRRLAGFGPLPGWVAELLRTAATAGGGTDLHVGLGKAALTMTGVIAAAGAVAPAGHTTRRHSAAAPRPVVAHVAATTRRATTVATPAPRPQRRATPTATTRTPSQPAAPRHAGTPHPSRPVVTPDATELRDQPHPPGPHPTPHLQPPDATDVAVVHFGTGPRPAPLEEPTPPPDLTTSPAQGEAPPPPPSP